MVPTMVEPATTGWSLPPEQAANRVTRVMEQARGEERGVFMESRTALGD
jgi:hypothetical protein